MKSRRPGMVLKARRIRSARQARTARFVARSRKDVIDNMKGMEVGKA